MRESFHLNAFMSPCRGRGCRSNRKEQATSAAPRVCSPPLSRRPPLCSCPGHLQQGTGTCPTRQHGQQHRHNHQPSRKGVTPLATCSRRTISIRQLQHCLGVRYTVLVDDSHVVLNKEQQCDRVKYKKSTVRCSTRTAWPRITRPTRWRTAPLGNKVLPLFPPEKESPQDHDVHEANRVPQPARSNIVHPRCKHVINKLETRNDQAVAPTTHSGR